MVRTRLSIFLIIVLFALIYTTNSVLINEPANFYKTPKQAPQRNSDQEKPTTDIVTPQIFVDAISHAIAACGQKEKTAQNTPPPDNSTFWFSLFLVIFTGVLAIVAIFQFYVLRNTLKETQKAADSAKKSADVAEATLHISQKAYLVFDHFAFEKSFQIGRIPQIRMSIINNGQTPAQILNVYTAVDVFKDFPEKPIYEIGQGKFVQNMIGANSKYTLGGIRRDNVITDKEFTDIHNAESTLYVWGRILYQDVFSKQWIAGFGVEYSPHGFLPVEGYNYIAEYEPENEQY